MVKSYFEPLRKTVYHIWCLSKCKKLCYTYGFPLKTRWSTSFLWTLLCIIMLLASVSLPCGVLGVSSSFDKAVDLVDHISKCTKLIYTQRLPLKQSSDTISLWMLSVIIQLLASVRLACLSVWSSGELLCSPLAHSRLASPQHFVLVYI
jgi:hypothetical protein